jgi:hypothetical protein
MNIPTEIPRRINPQITDPVSHSILFQFKNEDAKIDAQNNSFYIFPYSKNTFWTNFKYSCWGINDSIREDLKISIILITSDGYTYEIVPEEEVRQHTWYTTVWPIPSVKTSNKAGIYFKIKPFQNKHLKYFLRITLLGYLNLFPNANHYLLLSPLDTYQFVFHKNESQVEDDVEMFANGTIYNVENYDYIRDIIDKACGVRLIKRY